MKPIQLWLPTFYGGIAQPEFQRNRARMSRARKTEQVMWSMPGWEGPAGWKQEGVRVSCLNGEALQCVRILHIGDNGVVVGPGAASFPSQSVGGLLDSWLKEDFVRAVPGGADKPIVVQIPESRPGGVVFVRAELPVVPSSYFPFGIERDEAVQAQWPPGLDWPETVSPEMESGRLRAAQQADSSQLRLVWTAPFDGLQPEVISADDVFARDKMRLIAETNGKNLGNADATAVVEARDWIGEGRASVYEAWLLPILAKEGEEAALIAIESRFGISAGRLEEAYKIEELWRHLNKTMPVTRAWGVPGLMWTLFIDRLSNARRYWTCERCGGFITGRGHKRFCAESDNPECFHARKAAEKRRSRN
jgi:hypothetical protein